MIELVLNGSYQTGGILAHNKLHTVVLEPVLIYEASSELIYVAQSFLKNASGKVLHLLYKLNTSCHFKDSKTSKSALQKNAMRRKKTDKLDVSKSTLRMTFSKNQYRYWVADNVCQTPDKIHIIGFCLKQKADELHLITDYLDSDCNSDTNAAIISSKLSFTSKRG